MAIINNFYPPVIDTYMPAFSISKGVGECRIYFSISQYNSFSEIANAQITILNQNNNLNMLNEQKYPSGIMLKKVFLDKNKNQDDKYYISLSNVDLKDNIFIKDIFYKIQIRFTKTSAQSIPLDAPVQAIDSWLIQNLSHFSEWSSICLIRAISTPTLELINFDIDDRGELPWSSANTEISGTLLFEEKDETETLSSYIIKIFDSNNNLLFESNRQYANNYNNMNTFYYKLKYNFEVDKSYILKIEYVTNMMFEGYLSKYFTVVKDSEEQLDFYLGTKADEENGRILLTVKRDVGSKAFTGNVVIRRSSSEDNFSIWEDIETLSFNNITSIKEQLYDITIKHGVFYKYYLQLIDANKKRGASSPISKPILLAFDNMFLIDKERQLKIIFNPTVDGFRKVVYDNFIETLGSQYPYVRRSGNINYSQFSIGGLITCNMDEEESFITKKEIFGDNYNLYEKYNDQNGINQYNDIIWEKKFREEVLDFLYKDNIKLFKSPTEGNILVKITDVSISPVVELGRMIWSFSCSATEVNDFTLDNCKLYEITSLRR